uniref:Longitudinals lacking protein, isoforms A/B/D/L n=1 Tax=Cacopsylla melanoneura TaxID=428564 RepID=A0A8D8TBK4_9HEMI
MRCKNQKSGNRVYNPNIKYRRKPIYFCGPEIGAQNSQDGYFKLKACGTTSLFQQPGSPFVCVTCGRLYRYKRGLAQHQKYECGLEPQQRCPVCPYRCKQRGAMKSHIAIKHSL